MDMSLESQYSTSSIISNHGLVKNMREHIEKKVAILYEFDYIKSLPLETLVWQGLPGRNRRQV